MGTRATRFHAKGTCMRRVVAAGGVLAALGCGGAGMGATPESAMATFTAALRDEQYERAYNVMSESYRQRVSFKEFRRHLRNHPDEASNIAESLDAATDQAPRVTATVPYGDAEELKMVRQDGQWRLSGNVVSFYDQSTPRAALRSFVRAMERRRYDVVMRFVPEADREGMTVEQMKKAWAGEGREEIERLLSNLRSSLENPIEVVGDRATMPYGERFTVQFVREDGVWKIEDPD